jgi:hypothetical protein
MSHSVFFNQTLQSKLTTASLSWDEPVAVEATPGSAKKRSSNCSVPAKTLAIAVPYSPGKKTIVTP